MLLQNFSAPCFENPISPQDWFVANQKVSDFRWRAPFPSLPFVEVQARLPHPHDRCEVETAFLYAWPRCGSFCRS